jgi:hypothetical protein
MIDQWMERCIDARMCGWMNRPKEAKKEVICKYCALGHFVLEILTLIANTG